MDNILKQAQGALGGAGGQQQAGQAGEQAAQQGGGGFNLGNTIKNLQSGGNPGDMLNSMAGGGKQGEANEDYLDKGIDLVQQHVMGQGPQDNETAVEQAKDKAIAGVIRDKYQQTTGSEFPIHQKDQKFGGV